MLQLPSELGYFLRIIGYKWPESDESKLFQMGQRWMQFSGEVNKVLDNAERGASPVWSENTGQDIAAFAGHWKHAEGPAKVLKDAATAANLVGAGMTIVGAIVLALKVQMIVQLVQLAIQTAHAIAMAVPTFGASLGWIPTYNMITREAVGMIIDQVIGKLLNA
jgi:hypothetical protein